MMGDRHVPQGIAALEQWLAWRNECRSCGSVFEPTIKRCEDCGEKTTKRPLDPQTGRLAKTTDPDTWRSLETADAFVERSDAHGVGFVFAPDDGLLGVDLDDCRDPETGDIDTWAREIVDVLDGVTEVSPSGTGVHAYVSAEIPDGGNRKGDVEMYDRARYFTFTGELVEGSRTEIPDRQNEVDLVHQKHIYDEATEEAREADIDISDTSGASSGSVENQFGTPLDEIRTRDDKLDSLLTGSDAGYESTSEADMATCSKLWFWRFDAGQIAQLIRRHRRRPKVVDRDDYLELTIAKASRGERCEPAYAVSVDDDANDDRLHVLGETQRYESIDDADMPDELSFVIDKPPREGGSYWTMNGFTDRDKGFIVLAPRHAILTQHAETLDEIMPTGWSAVHLEGASRVCDCGGDLVPMDYGERTEATHDVRNIVSRRRVIDADDCPVGLCKGWFLKRAANFTDVVLTVPQLSREFEIGDRRHLFIDEEQTLGYYRPASFDLVELRHVTEPDGSVTVQLSGAPILDSLSALEDIRDRILEAKAEREAAAEARGGHTRAVPYEEDILEAVKVIDRITDALGVSAARAALMEKGKKITLSTTADELIDRLDEIDPPDRRTNDPNRLREKIEAYAAPHFWNDDADPGSVLLSVLFPYEQNRFHAKHTGRTVTIRHVGGRHLFFSDWLSQFEQVGIVGGPEGGRFCRDAGIPATLVQITKFRYDDEFVIMPIGKKDSDGDLEPVTRQRNRVKATSRKLNQVNHPHIAVTGTEVEARDHAARLTEGVVVKDPPSPSLTMARLWSNGFAACIYENSVVSRGIDVPFFDVTTVLSSGFASPYWESRAEYYLGEGDDEAYLEAVAVDRELTSRELTNAAFRMATNRESEPYMGEKVIVTAVDDADRIKYLDDRHLPRVPHASSAVNILTQITIPGSLSTTARDIYDQLGGSEKDFIDVWLREEISETKADRPRYLYSMLSRWVERRYFHSGEVCDRVLDLVEREGPITHGDLCDRLPKFEKGQIGAALKVLKKKGHVESSFVLNKKSGPPPKAWDTVK